MRKLLYNLLRWAALSLTMIVVTTSAHATVVNVNFGLYYGGSLVGTMDLGTNSSGGLSLNVSHYALSFSSGLLTPSPLSLDGTLVTTGSGSDALCMTGMLSVGYCKISMFANGQLTRFYGTNDNLAFTQSDYGSSPTASWTYTTPGIVIATQYDPFTSFSVTRTVPAPPAVSLMGIGLIALVATRRRKKKRRRNA